jgi:hypothetical protein
MSNDWIDKSKNIFESEFLKKYIWINKKHQVENGFSYDRHCYDS